MDEYLTDEQEVDRAKQWLRENGTFLVAGVLLGLGGLFGWQQWQDYQLSHAGQASIVWNQMSAAIDGERFNEVTETFELLETEYADTPYLDQGRLALARMHMDQNAPDKAASQLEMLIASGGDAQIRAIAELRLAQILLFQQKYDAALATLKVDEGSPFAPQFHDLRGDIYYAMEKLDDASAEYQLALASSPDAVFNRQFVEMKLDDVTGLLAASEPAAAAVDLGGGAADE